MLSVQKSVDSLEQTVQDLGKQLLGLGVVCLLEETVVGMLGKVAWEVDRQSI